MPDTDDPQFVINPSQVLAAVKTGGSLLTFATLFFTALAGFARNLDLNGFILFMQRDDIAKGIASAATAGYLVWRLSAAKRKKLREVIMARHAPNRVAMLSTDLLEQVSPAPPSRARETTMPRTRLVDASVLCGGATTPLSTTGIVAKIESADAFTDLHTRWAVERVSKGGTPDWREYLLLHGWAWDGKRWQSPVDQAATAPTYDGGQPRPTVIAGVDVSRRDEVPSAPFLPRTPEPDVLDVAAPAMPDTRPDPVFAVTIVNGVPRSPLTATVSAADGIAIILVEAHLHCAETIGTPFPAGRISAPCSSNCFVYALADKSYIAVAQAIDPPVAGLHFVGSITTPAPDVPADYFPSTRGPARPPTDPV